MPDKNHDEKGMDSYVVLAPVRSNDDLLEVDLYPEDQEFQCCDNCDLPDACSDFGCAIKQGIKDDPYWV